jgi:hypothetical protein
MHVHTCVYDCCTHICASVYTLCVPTGIHSCMYTYIIIYFNLKYKVPGEVVLHPRRVRLHGQLHGLRRRTDGAAACAAAAAAAACAGGRASGQQCDWRSLSTT